MENETNTIIETVEEIETTETTTEVVMEEQSEKECVISSEDTLQLEHTANTVADSVSNVSENYLSGEIKEATETTTEVETQDSTETELVSSSEELHEEYDASGEKGSSASNSSVEVGVSYDTSNLEALIVEQNTLIQQQSDLIEKQYAVTSTYLNLLTGTLLIIWIIHSVKGSTKKFTRHK